jgi:hypothetical protein
MSSNVNGRLPGADEAGGGDWAKAVPTTKIDAKKILMFMRVSKEWTRKLPPNQPTRNQRLSSQGAQTPKGLAFKLSFLSSFRPLVRPSQRCHAFVKRGAIHE